MEARNANAAAASYSPAAVAAAARRSEAERLLSVAEKLLQNCDLSGCKDFAVLAQETEPLLDGSDQILAVAEVLLAAEKRINNHHDWYAVLQIDRRSPSDFLDLELIKKQYRRLALLLHPDKNKFAFADAAFKLVADAWAVFNNSAKKSLYDNELSLVSGIGLVSLKNEREKQQQQRQQQRVPVWRSAGTDNKKAIHEEGEEETRVEVEVEDDEENQPRVSSFWTACPYCYHLHEYPRVYLGCCMRCQNCRRAFHAAAIRSVPPLVPGKEAYYCCWGVFPLGFASANSDGKIAGEGFPSWMPPIFPSSQTNETTTGRP